MAEYHSILKQLEILAGNIPAPDSLGNAIELGEKAINDFLARTSVKAHLGDLKIMRDNLARLRDTTTGSANEFLETMRQYAEKLMQPLAAKP